LADLLADLAHYKPFPVKIVTDQKLDAQVEVLELPPSGRVDYWPTVLESGESLRLLGKLEAELCWQQLPVQLFGRSIPQPRLTAFYGDAGVRYRYSGLTLDARGWTPELQQISQVITQYCGRRFNSVLCNLYRDGNDYMGWHADDEAELGPNPAIASVSFGAARRFVLKPREGSSERREFLLSSGSLLVMSGDLQRHWLHQLPKARRVKGTRINLTFRQIISPKPL
jgi:alkylated DNA repair dioxygenase AlkB